MSITINKDNNPESVFDKHYVVKCPHGDCGVPSNISAISIPRYEYLVRFRPETVGIVYRCDACNQPIFLKFIVSNYDQGNQKVFLNDSFEEVERPQETFDFKYLPEDVADDFQEALTSYSNDCLNAFAAMCRRTIQSASSNLGAIGKDKVLKQVEDLKGMGVIDDEVFSTLKQIVLDGHDGAHPHLPKLNEPRARVLLELMKDVLYELFVRKAKLQEAVELRKEAIKQMPN